MQMCCLSQAAAEKAKLEVRSLCITVLFFFTHHLSQMFADEILSQAAAKKAKMEARRSDQAAVAQRFVEPDKQLTVFGRE